MRSSNPRRTKPDVVMDAWLESGATTAGAAELSFIQDKLRKVFGAGGVESPASVARILADNGIRLRHPEVLQADSYWRERRLNEFFRPEELNFATISAALESVEKLEGLRLQLVAENDDTGVKGLLKYVRDLKLDLTSEGGDMAVEVAQWLSIWLQTPEIFDDWVSLRRNSKGFVEKFRDG